MQVWGGVFAYDFESDGIYYKVIDETAKTVEVTYPNESTPTPSSPSRYSISNVTIPSTITNGSNTYTVMSIGQYAFYQCETLTEVTIPESANNIGALAFCGCSALTSVVISNGVETIGSDAFEDCTGLTSVTIGNSVKSIGNYAFWGCKNLTSITIPNSVESIGWAVFQQCTSLTSVVIGSSVKTLGKYVFNDCTNLQTIISIAQTAPTPTESNSEIFTNIPSTCTLYIPKNSTGYDKEPWNSLTDIQNIAEDDGSFTYTFNEDNNTATVKKGTSVDGAVTIPKVVLKDDVLYIVTTIDEYAFNSCTGLTSINIPNSVMTIGAFAFSNCSALTEMKIPDGVTRIETSAFKQCNALKKVTIPNSVIFIGAVAFGDCGLTELEIPSSVEEISDNNSFMACNELETITVAEGNSFYYSDGSNAIIKRETKTLVTGCKNTVIPEDVESIGSSAFRGCTSLTEITIPQNVKSIGDNAFKDCTYLTTITCHTITPPSCSSNVFPSRMSTLSVIVPKDSQEYYEDAAVWQGFTNISEDENDNDINIPLGETGYATYCSKYNLDFRGMEGVKAYVASSYNESEGAIVIEEVEVVPAGTGIILIGEEGMHDVPITDSSNVINRNLLSGTNNAKQLLKAEGNYTNYVLGRKGTEVGFFQPKDNETISAHKAYLQLPTSQAQGISYLSIGGSDDTTGIEQVTPQAAPQGDAIYNLNGQCVETPQRGGIYIVNGKKVVLK